MSPEVQMVDGLGLVAVDERLRALDTARWVLLVIVALAGVAGMGRRAELLALSGAYAGVTLLASLARPHATRWARVALSALLIVDGLYLAAVMAASGGMASPLRYLVLAHVVAAALLASAPTCGKLLVWHSLLVVMSAAGQRSGFAFFAGADYPIDERLSFVAALWLLGATTCAAAGLNERVLRRARADIEALAQAMSALEGMDSPCDVAQALVDVTTSAYGFRRALLLDARGDTVLAGSAGATGPRDARGLPHPGKLGARAGPGRLLAAAAVADGPLLVDRLHPDEDARLAALLPDAANLVVVPLSDDDRRVATLVLEHHAARIDARTVELVCRVAAHGALALGSAHLVEQLRGRADRDGLTDVANRGALDRELDRLVTAARSSGEGVGVLLVDIDHFKRLNDTHGHQVGDQVLQRVAAMLLRGCRPEDFVGRYGGEEFAVLLPGAGPEETERIAERIRRDIAALTGPGTPVTVSIGYACMPWHATDVSGLLAVADAALYAAKDAGRNRVARPGDAPASAPQRVGR